MKFFIIIFMPYIFRMVWIQFLMHFIFSQMTSVLKQAFLYLQHISDLKLIFCEFHWLKYFYELIVLWKHSLECCLLPGRKRDVKTHSSFICKIIFAYSKVFHPQVEFLSWSFVILTWRIKNQKKIFFVS